MSITHRELCEAGAKWILNNHNWNYKCPYVAIELVSAAFENPDIFGLSGNHSILIEVKVSRSDFKADAKKRHRQEAKLGIGMTRYYLVPKDLIKPEEVANDWGLIYFESPKTFEVVKKSKVFTERNYASELNLMQSIVRRLAGKQKILDFRIKKDNP